MIKYSKYFFLSFLIVLASCKEILEPKPVASLIDELVLNEPNDVGPVQIGLYSAFRGMGGSVVIAGDFTADLLTHNGTFIQYRELSNKEISSANANVSGLWAGIYNTVYVANFILERLPDVKGVPASLRNEVTATAHFLRGYAYFIGAHTYGGMPLVTTTDLATNRIIPKSSKEEILALVLSDYQAALTGLPEESSDPGFASIPAVQAALARYYLYNQEWALAEQYTTELINNDTYTLPASFSDVVLRDFTSEAIFEAGYTQNDDPGTLNNLFVARREIIPSNRVINDYLVGLRANSTNSGDRRESVTFDPQDLRGVDNGWSVAKYGNQDSDNNNIVIFRLAEMYLIRAEARARLNRITGANSATEDINILRARADAPLVSNVNAQAPMLELIEEERVYELAFEGHRWYDLVRTGRANVVMSSFSANWKETYNVWPIPLGEIQRNPGLAGAQNPGY
ncbi:RagB/SusD family nutrient uptake outer membrane protein [Rhodocytophaga rosea]|uniref:RagB/SusD family nutrient uptake outer membrane protein n=1 Tax=Rhodocytophaga rosea TaxID=2704465 RepID=A0A6C0GCJ0_9BACT|nr:RagB/SusD family nutrient uptake outer membrane protein [Rhodocytophaga rosea]QHT65533.1 RagB/SusD family nutrient uptake outer membrane protein [Rhodocytophaga rosea]